MDAREGRGFVRKMDSMSYFGEIVAPVERLKTRRVPVVMVSITIAMERPTRLISIAKMSFSVHLDAVMIVILDPLGRWEKGLVWAGKRHALRMETGARVLEKSHHNKRHVMV
tara:strand:+ start:12450 stop:12785 length:336 start_codon:yes stop_codon:yes gene_type:complete